MKIIYDVGANNGDDIPYYLQKADLVVAIEANPVLIEGMAERFEAEIASGHLVLESCVVTAERSEGAVPFYINKHTHVQSQFPRPPDAVISHFEKVELPSKPIAGIVATYGTPHYIKIDVEHYDKVLLKALFLQGVFPAYMSAESHEIDVFATFVTHGAYKAFKLVEGETIPQIYGRHKIATRTGLVEYSFPDHSAGPFGNDIAGPWFAGSTFVKVLAGSGFGWKDIHVSNVDFPEI